jgi:hypothetical protein
MNLAPRRALAALLLAGGLLADSAAHAWRSEWLPVAEDCDSLANEPVHVAIDFATDIQPLLDVRCAPCHTDGSFGGMNLRPENLKASWLGQDETGQPSGYPGFVRVTPGRPTASLVFLRLNCANAGSAMNPIPRMPPGGTTTDLQALVHDWIALGAILRGTDAATTTDRMFLGTFDLIR